MHAAAAVCIDHAAGGRGALAGTVPANDPGRPLSWTRSPQSTPQSDAAVEPPSPLSRMLGGSRGASADSITLASPVGALTPWVLPSTRQPIMYQTNAPKLNAAGGALPRNPFPSVCLRTMHALLCTETRAPRCDAISALEGPTSRFQLGQLHLHGKRLPRQRSDLNAAMCGVPGCGRLACTMGPGAR